MGIWTELRDGIKQAAAGLALMARPKDELPSYDEWLESGEGRAYIAEQQARAEESIRERNERRALGIKDPPDPGTREWYIEQGWDGEPDWDQNPAVDPIHGTRYYDDGRIIAYDGTEIRGPIVEMEPGQ
jgi:hypothetical protein